MSTKNKFFILSGVYIVLILFLWVNPDILNKSGLREPSQVGVLLEVIGVADGPKSATACPAVANTNCTPGVVLVTVEEFNLIHWFHLIAIAVLYGFSYTASWLFNYKDS